MIEMMTNIGSPLLQTIPNSPLAQPAVGYIGLMGVLVEEAPLRHRLESKDRLKKLLSVLTVREKFDPTRKVGMGTRSERGFQFVKLLPIPSLPTMRPTPIYIFPHMVAHRMLLHGMLDRISDVTPTKRFQEPRPLPNLISEECLTLADGVFFPYQQTAVDHFVTLLQAEPHRSYMEMKTGLGKTRTACGIIQKLGVATIIVVPTLAIRDQWKAELMLVMPNIRCGFYGNAIPNAATAATHDVSLIVINTARQKPPDFFTGYGLVILDEAHEYHASQNKKILWNAQTHYVLGLSATPNEAPSGMDRFVNLFLGNPIDVERIPGFDLTSDNFQVKVRAVQFLNGVDYCRPVVSAKGTVCAISTIAQMIQEPVRIKLIVCEAERLMREVPDSHGIFIFAELRDFLIVLRDALSLHFDPSLVYAPELDEISVLRGGATADDVQASHSARIILTTYGFSRRGISISEMTSMILATPRRHGLKQIIGRILRKGSDETIVREIVDVVDARSCLKNQFQDRKAVYLERKYPLAIVPAFVDQA